MGTIDESAIDRLLLYLKKIVLKSLFKHCLHKEITLLLLDQFRWKYDSKYIINNKEWLERF